MASLRLTFACGPFDRTQPLRDGSIKPEGIDLTYLAMQPAEIFWRMLQYNEFDMSEMSLSNYAILVSRGNAPYVAIPAFPSRVFRHGYFFINTTKGIEKPSDIRLSQAPPGTELGDLLERGELDFLMTANSPLSFRRGAKTVRRLFPNYADIEKDYYRRTHIYPIMHTVVIRRDIYEQNPWVALSMYKALCRAKEYTYRWIVEGGSAKVTSAWLLPLLEEEQAIIGMDWYPYGIEQNRPSIEALLKYLHEQGLTHRRVALEELFVPSTLRDIPLSE